jgi:hypothetical protein
MKGVKPMNGSTMSLGQGHDWHPVHRANALLRQALLEPVSALPDPAELWDDTIFRPNPARADLTCGPVSIMAPASLTALFEAPSSDDAHSCQPRVTYALDGSAAQASLAEASERDEMLDGATQVQLQGLVQAFHRRQRQASLLVACSIVLAVVLTLGGFILMFSMTGSESDASGNPKAGTSAAHAERHAALTSPLLGPIRLRVNRSAKTASLLIPAKAEAGTPALTKVAFGADVILTTPKHPLALAPLLPLGSARYLLLQGLPANAELSAGRRTGTGAWMVKDVDVSNLTLTLGEDARGDYPVDVYLLEASNGPQARRRLILRVDGAPQVFSGGLSLGWSMPRPMPDVSQKAVPAATSDPISELAAGALRKRAQTCFANGDIAAARRLLTDLAVRGDADAAYELALTYDREVLAKARIVDVDGDAGKAQAWYKYAAQAGHAGAAQRLQMLAARPRAGA